MQPTYFASFIVGNGGSGSQIDIAAVIHAIDAWIFDSPKRKLIRPPNLDYAAESTHYDLGPSVSLQTRNLMETEEAVSSRVFAIRFQHPDNDNRLWRTDIVLSEKEVPSRRVRFSVSVAVGSMSRNIQPVLAISSRPRIVLDVIDEFGAREAYPIKNQHITIRPGEAADFLSLLESRERQLPVVFVSCRNSTGLPVVDASDIAHQLAGIAYVCVASSPEVSKELQDVMDNRLNTYDGAVRVYWPDFSQSDSPYRHKLWIAERVEAIEDHYGRLQYALLGLIGKLSVTRFVPDVSRWEDVERLAARKVLVKLRSEGDLNQLIEYASEELKKQERFIAEQSEQISDLQQKLAGKTSEAEQWREAYENERKGAAAVVDRPRPAPRTVMEAIDHVREEHTGHIHFIRSGIKDEANQFEDVERAHSAMKWLATTYRMSRTGEKSCPDLDLSCRQETGFRYSGHQSDVTMGKYKTDYQVKRNGKTHALREHIGIGTDTDPRRTIRLAFFFDPDDNQVVVGFVGQHQRTDKSN